MYSQPPPSNKPVYKTPQSQVALGEWYNAKLQLLPLSVERLWIPTRFGTTHILAAGSLNAPPVILLHGLSNASIEWKWQLGALAEKYRVYAVDIIGEAGPSAPNRLNPESTDYPLWLLDVLYGLKLGKANFIARSFGGRIALQLAGYMPGAIERLALIGPYGIGPLGGAGSFGGFFSTMWAMLFPTQANIRRAARRLYPPGVTLSPEAEQDMIDHFLIVQRHIGFSNYGVLAPLPEELLRCCRVPILLLMGKHNPIMRTTKIVERARQLLPDLQVEIIEEGGQDLCEEQPVKTNQALLRFLAKAG